MATPRFTLGAVLSTVSETAATVTNVMTTVNTLSMANAFVTKAAAEQADRYILEADDAKHRIVSEIAMERMAREDAVIAYCGNDAAKQKRYNDHFNSLMALVVKAKP